MFSGDGVVGDEETGLTIDERDRTAETPLPEPSAIGFTRRCRVTEGGERPGGVYLLCPDRGQRQSGRQRSSADQTEVGRQAHAEALPLTLLLVY